MAARPSGGGHCFFYMPGKGKGKGKGMAWLWFWRGGRQMR
jgi:hypothetical protein